jgi:hypothetical protein
MTSGARGSRRLCSQGPRRTPTSVDAGRHAPASNLDDRVITAVRRIPFLGELASVGVGEPNRWMVVGQLSSPALILFVADASLEANGQ